MPESPSPSIAVQRLCSALDRFQSAAQSLQLPPLAGREWYEILARKLRPQLGDESFLIAAVVGGTNIGKSVVFNHAAGFPASATSPLASGTRHPTCLAPVGFSQRHNLQELFPGFAITPWSGPEPALRDDDGVHRLFWRESEHMPANLLLLDTPDVDSDARINWERADHIRQSADVLLAVITQQKYNDAAVKEFFRKAAKEDKAVLLVINQLLLPEDEAYWPLWVETFCNETGIAPEAIYVAPMDRRAADSLKLPFFERAMPHSGHSAESNTPRSLLEDLSRLKFLDVKLRSLRGALRTVLDPRAGAPAWLDEVRRRTKEFQSAAELLATHKLAEVSDWPTVPAPAVVAELRRWWRDQREGWSRQVHGFYNALGEGIAWPFRKARALIQGEQKPLLDSYREQEWSAILTTVESVYDRLNFLAELGNDLLQPRLRELLSGTSRADVLNQIRSAHHEVDFATVLRDLVDEELRTFRTDRPDAYEMFRKLDAVAAAARPATSVILFVTGFGPVGHAITPVFADAAVQGVVHFAGDVAGGTVAAAVGETVLSSGTGTSVAYVEARFRRLQTTFTARRAAWLASHLQQALLGSMPADLHRAASLLESPEYRAVRDALSALSDSVTHSA